jgi:hypothetical protein
MPVATTSKPAGAAVSRPDALVSASSTLTSATTARFI